jgi:hypothetical protein
MDKLSRESLLDVKAVVHTPVCLLESSFFLKSEFRESELFSDDW